MEREHLFDPKRHRAATYNRKYSEGGWRYDHAKETRDLRRIVAAAGLSPGAKVLEIGCGMGFHSQILFELGFDVVGNDLSEVGIEEAARAYPGPTFICGDTLTVGRERFERPSFAAILSRGHSWYHYELNGISRKGFDVPALTRELFEYLHPNGVFILCIRTDFSGLEHQDGVLNNRFPAYLDLFRPLGNVVYVSDANGNLLFTEEAARLSRNDIVIITRKFPGRPLTALPFETPAREVSLRDVVSDRLGRIVKKV